MMKTMLLCGSITVQNYMLRNERFLKKGSCSTPKIRLILRFVRTLSSSQEVCSLTVRDFKSKDFLRKWDLAGATINKIS